MRTALCTIPAFMALSACGPSPETVAKFNAQNAALWACAAQNGVSPPLTIAQKHRAGGNRRQSVLEVVPNSRVSASTAGKVNLCTKNRTAPEPDPPQVTYFFNSVFVNATPEELGDRVPLKQTNAFLLQAERQYGSASPIPVVPPGTRVKGVPGGVKPTQNIQTTTISATRESVSRPVNRGGICPKHAAVLYGGTTYCIGN